MTILRTEQVQLDQLLIDTQGSVNERVRVLESIVDHYGLAETVSALSIVCDEKGQHIEDNWQDDSLAAHWWDAGNKLDKLAARFYQVLGLYR